MWASLFLRNAGAGQRYAGAHLEDLALSSTRPKSSNATDVDDAAVIARVAAGSPAAFAELYDRYASLLLGLGVRMMGVRAEAEDVLHDVFVEVWKRAGDFDAARGTVRSWLAMRMRSRCLDRKKSPRLARTIPFSDTELDRRPAPFEDPLTRIERQRVRHAVATLSAEQRAVVDLAYFAGLSTLEIGEQLGIPQGTVKSRLFAAREKLAPALRDVDTPLKPGGAP